MFEVYMLQPAAACELFAKNRPTLVGEPDFNDLLGDPMTLALMKADRVDRHAHVARGRVDLRPHVEHLTLLLAHVLANELRPELPPLRPAKPLDRPEVLHVARPGHRVPEAHAPARENGLTQLALENLLSGSRLQLRREWDRPRESHGAPQASQIGRGG